MLELLANADAVRQKTGSLVGSETHEARRTRRRLPRLSSAVVGIVALGSTRRADRRECADVRPCSEAAGC